MSDDSVKNRDSRIGAAEAEKHIKKYLLDGMALPTAAAWALFLAACALFAVSLCVKPADDPDFRYKMSVPAMFLALFSCVPALMLFIHHLEARRSVGRLKRLGLLEQALGELEDSGRHILCTDKSVAAENFVFMKNMSAVMRYEDILYYYEDIVIEKKRGENRARFVIAVKSALSDDLPSMIYLGGSPGINSAIIKGLIERRSPDAVYGRENEEEFMKLRKRRRLEARRKNARN